MTALVFEPEPFRLRGADQLEWDVPPVRARCTNLPADVENCTSLDDEKPIQCHPNFTGRCPALPEVWESHKINSIPFFYEPTVRVVAGTNNKRFGVTAKGNRYKVGLIPDAWMAAYTWTIMMAAFGMPISAVLTAGAGRYCRCVRKPTGVCREAEETWPSCTGRTISDHGFGDALDIIGVEWKDKAAVGSSTNHTVIHSWKDDVEQAPLLIRINALLRIAFRTVLDYSRADHRDHFHCDMNMGNGGVTRPVWQEGPCERNYIITALRRLGYVQAGTEVTWPNARAGLVRFATRINQPLPADQNDKLQWRPLVNRLFGCTGLPSQLALGCRAQ